MNLYIGSSSINPDFKSGFAIEQQFPKSYTNLFNIIGAVNKSLGKLDDAIISGLNNALSINPDYAEPIITWAIAL